jgi:hypothetical protein
MGRNRPCLLHHFSVAGKIYAVLLDQNLGNIPEDLLADPVMKSGHDCQNDNQCCHPQGHPGDGDEGDNGDEGLLALGPQVTQADEPFVTHKTRLKAKGEGQKNSGKRQ